MYTLYQWCGIVQTTDSSDIVYILHLTAAVNGSNYTKSVGLINKKKAGLYYMPSPKCKIG